MGEQFYRDLDEFRAKYPAREELSARRQKRLDPVGAKGRATPLQGV